MSILIGVNMDQSDFQKEMRKLIKGWGKHQKEYQDKRKGKHRAKSDRKHYCVNPKCGLPIAAGNRRHTCNAECREIALREGALMEDGKLTDYGRELEDGEELLGGSYALDGSSYTVE